jgi:hypothetical protein
MNDIVGVSSREKVFWLKVRSLRPDLLIRDSGKARSGVPRIPGFLRGLLKTSGGHSS